MSSLREMVMSDPLNMAQSSFLCFLQDLIVLRDGFNLLLPKVRRWFCSVSEMGSTHVLCLIGFS